MHTETPEIDKHTFGNIANAPQKPVGTPENPTTAPKTHTKNNVKRNHPT